MRKLLTPLLLLPFALSAQTTWPVDVGGSTIGSTDPYYAPQDIVIQQGDIVHWVASSGTHNIYGQLDDFPANPEGFDSGAPDPDLDYTHTFNIPGFYTYHCTQMGHAVTQTGTIVVMGTSGIVPQPPKPIFTLFPVPANDQIMVSFEGCRGAMTAQVLDRQGRLVREQAVKDNSVNPIDLTGLAPGQYYIAVESVWGRSAMKPFVKL